MLVQAKRLRPNLKIGRIRFPTREKQPVYIEGQEDNLLVRDRANYLVFDPFDGTLLSQRFGEDLSVHVRISEAADPLHFGTWGGYPSKVMYFIFGVALTSISITGAYIYAMRVSARLKSKSESNASYWTNGWIQMGFSKWLALVLVLVSLLLIFVQVIIYE